MFPFDIQGGSNMTGTNCDLFTHNQSRPYLNHIVCCLILRLHLYNVGYPWWSPKGCNQSLKISSNILCIRNLWQYTIPHIGNLMAEKPCVFNIISCMAILVNHHFTVSPLKEKRKMYLWIMLSDTALERWTDRHISPSCLASACSLTSWAVNLPYKACCHVLRGSWQWQPQCLLKCCEIFIPLYGPTLKANPMPKNESVVVVT
jgi:hypothetical protein